MPKSELPHFPRGFLLATRSIDAPPTYVAGPLLPNFYVHPWTHVDTAERDGLLVIVLGTCVSTHPNETEPVTETLLEALAISETTFYETLGRFAGRYAIIYGNRVELNIVQDATAMRSVFYAPGVAASHALLVDRALGGSGEQNGLPFRYGYPGNGTPHNDVRLLTANTVLDVNNGTVQRFWPHHELPARSCEEAASILLEGSANALRQIASTHVPVMAFTAGLDSRTLLAVALHAGIECPTYTYGAGRATEVDRRVSTELAARFGFQHTAVPSHKLSSELDERLVETHYSSHHRYAVSAMSAWIDDPQHTVAITANLLEIGRSFYGGRRRRGGEPPVTAAAMTDMHYWGMGPKVREEIGSYGVDSFKQVSDAEYGQFLRMTGFTEAAEFVDPFDLFYWEHRMSAWHGIAMNERDFYAEPFIPFNSRDLLEAMLSVPQVERDAGTVQHTLIESVDSQLSDLPVNPTLSELEAYSS